MNHNFYQLVYRANDFDDTTDLYVTDYTSNSIPSFYKPTAAKQIDGRRVLCIGARGDKGTRGLTYDLEFGDIFLFKSVRVGIRNGYIKGTIHQPASTIIKISNATQNETILAAKNAILLYVPF